MSPAPSTELTGSMATSALVGGLPVPGVSLRIGQNDTEVDRQVTEEE